MTSPKLLFIDTSAVIDLAFKKNGSDILLELLNRYDRKYVAHYSKMEIKMGFLQNLVYLHNKIVTCSSWAEVQEAISRLSATPQKHKLGSVLEAMAAFWKSVQEVTPSEIRKEHGDIPLGEYLRVKASGSIRIWIKQVWRGIDNLRDEMVNPMNCYPDIEPPISIGKLMDNSRRTCDKSGYQCEIKNFFRERRDKLKKIEKQLRALQDVDVETSKRIKSLHEIFRLLDTSRQFSNREPNRKDCWNSSDAILAMIAPEGADILNHNQRHYDPICEAIGLVSLRYPSTKN